MMKSSRISCRASRTVWKGKDDVADKAKKLSVFMLRADIHKSRSFYDTNNIYIAGDNIEALKLLRNGYAGRIKMICISSLFNKHKHLTYIDTQNNIHDRLKMMYSRLFIAAELLSSDGVLFIRVDNDELPNIRTMLNDVFKKENYVTRFVWQQTAERTYGSHIICYVKDVSHFYAGSDIKMHSVEYKYFDRHKNMYYKLKRLHKRLTNTSCIGDENLNYPINAPDGSEIYPVLSNGTAGCWRWDSDKMQREISAGNVEFIKKNGMLQAYEKVYKINSDENKQREWKVKLKKLFTYKVHNNSQPEELLRFFMKSAGTRGGDIIMDFGADSFTTACAVMKQNAEDGIKRRFIIVQTPENTEINSDTYKAGYKEICDIAIERINSAAEYIAHSDTTYAKETDTGYKFFRIVPSTVMPI